MFLDNTQVIPQRPQKVGDRVKPYYFICMKQPKEIKTTVSITDPVQVKAIETIVADKSRGFKNASALAWLIERGLKSIGAIK